MNLVRLSALPIAFAAGIALADPPVTRDEVSKSLARFETVVAKRLSITIPPSKLRGAQTASRAEIAAEFVRILDAVQPSFRFTPRPYRVVESSLRGYNKGVAVDHMRRLIRLGMAGPVGPLAAGGEGLSPEEFGDALGLFMTQLASYTHQPDPKWTPSLQPGG